jgi:hypothetical protein
MVASIILIPSDLTFLLNETLVCYCRPQTFKLCHNFKESVSYLYVIILLALRFNYSIQFNYLHITLHVTPYVATIMCWWIEPDTRK